MKTELEQAIEDGELFTHYSFKVDPGQEPLRMDLYLTHRIPNATRTKIQKAAQSGCIVADGKPIKPNYKVRPGETISIVLPDPPRDTTLVPEKMDLDIPYEDDELLIVNKSAGIVVHPGFNNYTGTLVHGLSFHFSQLPVRDDLSRPGLVHRIDKDTSGLLVIAKTETALNKLAKQFFDHSIDRVYYALVWGDLKEDSGTINTLLGRDTRDRKKIVVTQNEEIGKIAITHYKVVKRYHFLTLITCKLETGRTHQIRAHMQSIGHPLFSDATYGGDSIQKGMNFSKFSKFMENCFGIMPRQALHAFSLGFVHPKTNENVYFKQALPPDFQGLLDKLDHYIQYNIATI